MLTEPMRDRLRVGVIGLRFGSQVHIPAFRSDPRCDVIALAGRDAGKAADIARALDVPSSYADWRELAAAPDVDAVGIAVPPAAQPAVIAEAVRQQKHVFCEKPLAASVDDARLALLAAETAGVVHGIDFIFPEIAVWQQAKASLADGAIGRPVHFAYTWRTETYASRTNAPSWKNRPAEGGGVLGNFVSHVAYNIEWLLGRIRGFEGLVQPRDRRQGRGFDGVVRLENGVTGSLSVTTDAFLGSGHVVEIYGDEGTLVLHNSASDYVTGFRLSIGTRASGALECVLTHPHAGAAVDGRLEPVSALVRRFIDAIHGGRAMKPTLADGVRVQELLALAEAAEPGQQLAESPSHTIR
jgi:predicted dehydrogenase